MMRRSPPAMALPGPNPETRHDWQTIKTLLPYLWAVSYTHLTLPTSDLV